MNHIYKIVRNHAGKLVVTGENASRHLGVSEKHVVHGIGQCVALALCGLVNSSYAADIVCQDSIGSTATGVGAIACGHADNAQGDLSIALGYMNNAQGYASTALGNVNKAQGDVSTALGYVNKAQGYASTALGAMNFAHGASSSAIGSMSGVDYRNIESDETKILSVAGVKVTATSKDVLSITEINGVAVTQAELNDFLTTVRNGGNVAFAKSSTVMGSQNLAVAEQSSALGFNNVATGEQSSAIGNGNSALGNYSSASGLFNVAEGHFSNAFGYGNSAVGQASSVFGEESVAKGEASVAIGSSNFANGMSSSAVGSNNYAKGDGASAFGSSSGSNYSNVVSNETKIVSVAGVKVTASGRYQGTITEIAGVAVRPEELNEFLARVNQGGSVAFAQNSTTMGSQNLAIGVKSSAIGFNNLASGEASNAVGAYNIVNNEWSNNNWANGFGISNVVSGGAAQGFGFGNKSLGDFSSSFGVYNTAIGNRSSAFGSASGNNYTNIKYDDTDTQIISVAGVPVTSTTTSLNTITHINGIAVTESQRNAFLGSLLIGGNVSLGDNSSVLGSQSIAFGKNSTALGYDSVADEENSISIGRAGAEKRLMNLASGKKDTDAVNMSQINAVVTALGGGAAFGEGFKAPKYTIQNIVYNNVGAAFNAVDGVLDDLTGRVTTLENNGGGGVNGDSAYQVAVKNGFGGTEPQWLASLKGDQGLKGDKGDQGVQGLKGDKGDQGIQGLKGDAGAAGNGGGVNGKDGKDGLNGLNGVDGKDGAKGDKGDQGLQGLKGDKGDQGLKGDKGDQGLNAFEVAVKSGFVGTEQQWLDSLGSENNPYLAIQSNTAKTQPKSQATGTDAIALGAGAIAQGKQSISIGVGNKITGNNAGAFGDPNVVSGNASYAVGNNNTISGENTFVVGNNVNTAAKNAVVLGNDSASNRDNTVSVGATDKERQIIHVADATQATDAVNLRQMQAADHATLNDAKSYSDQGNTATLRTAQNYTDSRVNQLNHEFGEFKKETYAAIASSMAVAGLPQPVQAGDSIVTAAVGAWNSEQGIAIGVSGVAENNKFLYKAAGTTNTRGDFGGSIGMGWRWK